MTEKHDDGGPAFPMPSGPEPRVDEFTHYNEGMTLWDYYAAAALSGTIARMSTTQAVEQAELEARIVKLTVPEMIAKASGLVADAMLAERRKRDIGS